jgi:hypothetical protein
VNVSDRYVNRWDRSLAPGARLTFRVEYTNLGEEARSILLYALTLRDGERQLCHKLGYAKAIGMGAAVIRIRAMPPNPAPEPGPEIARYLQGPAFRAFAEARRIA